MVTKNPRFSLSCVSKSGFNCFKEMTLIYVTIVNILNPKI